MTAVTWKLTELSQWIEAHLPAEKETLESLKSLSRARYILNYHLVLARDAFAEYNQSDDARLEMYSAIAGFDSGFSRAALIHEANIIAAIHTVRNYADILAQVVNSLVLPEPLSEFRASLYNVSTKLEDSCLKERMTELNESYWFRYLVAFSNISKHRRLLESNPTVTFDKDNNIESAGLRVQKFSYEFGSEEVTFEPCWGHHLVEEIYNVYRSILELGQELNSHIMK
ncbi:TPA: hypothetical protein QEM76_001938 [Pseudomonas putida]|uniref:hypothetical protein n=1 Tax=Pseudomonas putida TaxID=303 RepID=UPI00235C104A|nr:hypothetical protein [Pseudomonas putida]GLO08279.1 hypothetical protein PPUJ20005_22480 [Pseudomonas putida]HDS0983540.1 hypothetical protein [Pseudomonas putida]HDS1800490.1 hypothetical protein [Pseudomonas putida]HDS1805254.1 hypothetical protein [Pseudomonas putida]